MTAESLPDALVQLFRSSDGGGGNSDAAARKWIRALHAAFYAPTVRGAAANKFLELEAALMEALTRLASEAPASAPDAATAVWTFALQVLLLLAQEPTTPLPESGEVANCTHELMDATHASLTRSEPETRGAKPTKLKVKKKSAQPYAPLAFVVVNALRKLSQADQEEEEVESGKHSPSFAAQVQRLGETDADLRAFCQRGLENPREVVRPRQRECLFMRWCVSVVSPA